jgi:hypothetical protein
MHTNVGHDNNVDDLLIVHIHRHQFLSTRKKKNRTMVTQMCRLSVLVRSFLFHFYSFSPVVALYIQGNNGQKKRGKESMFVYVHIHMHKIFS